MKTATLDELRSDAELRKAAESILVTERGEPIGLFLPLDAPEKLPMEVKRELFDELAEELTAERERRGISEDDILRDFLEFRQRRRGR